MSLCYYVPAKAWGAPSDPPILCVHAMQDNAASFDKLLPLLPARYYYVCIDLPGHGLSSHFPPGMLLDWLNYLLACHRVVNHFAWTKFIWLGHSLGGQLGTHYAAMFPQLMDRLILLDAMNQRKTKVEDTLTKVRDILTNQMNLEEKLNNGTQPVYTKEQVVSKLKQRLLLNEISTESAEILFTRAVSARDGGFVFNFDQRLKNKIYLVMTEDQQHSIIRNIQCQTLCILSQDSFNRVWIVNENYIGTYCLYSRHPKFHVEMVDSGHDMELEEPEKLSGLISDFLD
ncbi:serine hydrolase-like protein [Diaphorina citri]|uniref:Serine hydrolase-like protein n=1 Tax=Diaphorina citri TaxID=121845 RepID=A0A3Q0IUA5_DIACI|nr:serine hydrolase-like protein [Diaphorina citri]